MHDLCQKRKALMRNDYAYISLGKILKDFVRYFSGERECTIGLACQWIVRCRMWSHP